MTLVWKCDQLADDEAALRAQGEAIDRAFSDTGIEEAEIEEIRVRGYDRFDPRAKRTVHVGGYWRDTPVPEAPGWAPLFPTNIGADKPEEGPAYERVKQWEDAHRDLPVEHMAIVDPDGTLRHEISQGLDYSTEFNDDQAIAMKGAIISHNHPKHFPEQMFANGPSPADLMVMRAGRAGEMRVARQGGATTRVSLTEMGSNLPAREFGRIGSFMERLVSLRIDPYVQRAASHATDLPTDQRPGYLRLLEVASNNLHFDVLLLMMQRGGLVNVDGVHIFKPYVGLVVAGHQLPESEVTDIIEEEWLREPDQRDVQAMLTMVPMRHREADILERRDPVRGYYRLDPRTGRRIYVPPHTREEIPPRGANLPIENDPAAALIKEENIRFTYSRAEMRGMFAEQGFVAMHNIFAMSPTKGEVGKIQWVELAPTNTLGAQGQPRPTVVQWIHVGAEYRRRGLGSSLFLRARRVSPDLKHSADLTPLGKRFAQSFPPEMREADEDLVIVDFEEAEVGDRIGHPFRGNQYVDVPSLDSDWIKSEGVAFEHNASPGWPRTPWMQGNITHHEIKAIHPKHGEIGFLRWHENRAAPLMLPGVGSVPSMATDNVVGIVYVHPLTRRKGIASAMYRRAKQITPSLHHSPSQTPLGKQWAKTIESRWEDAIEANDDALEVRLLEHFGPGPHASGSPQTVHGGKVRGVRARLEDAASLGLSYEHTHHLAPDSGNDYHALSARTEAGRMVGYVNWIVMPGHPTYVRAIWTDPLFRRRGIATSLFLRARNITPDLTHSYVLTDDGRRFAPTVGDAYKEEEPDMGSNL